jgi:Ca2+-binding RTX toxin-like protein
MANQPADAASRAPLAVALTVAALVGIPAAALGATGNFSQPSTSPETAGPAPLSVTAAKLNSDANIDLAVTDFVSSSVSILLGDGNGNFTPAATSPETSDGTSNSVAAGNFNGDSNTDLATANLDGGDVTILLGSASGDFTEPGTSPEVAGTGPISIVAANLGGDANTDLAVLNNDTTDVTILLGDGAGAFTAAGTSPETVGGDPRSIVAANFNGDSNTDLAVANRGTDNVTILLGSATGDFAEPASSTEGAGDAPNGITAANFGGDGNVDLAVANRDSDNVTILLGDGTGNFTAAGTSPEPAGNAPRSLVAANLGGSISNDLAVANAESDNVSILLGNGAGNFTAAGTSPEPAGDEPFSIAAANLGGTASPDLATANPGGGIVTILLNDAPLPPVKCGGLKATKTGTAGPNVINGTPRKDVIAGLGGKDRIRGRAGNDVLCGGGGRDKLIGGGGRDRLLGQAGKDICKGGPKRDVARKCEVKRSI